MKKKIEKIKNKRFSYRIFCLISLWHFEHFHRFLSLQQLTGNTSDSSQRHCLCCISKQELLQHRQHQDHLYLPRQILIQRRRRRQRIPQQQRQQQVTEYICSHSVFQIRNPTEQELNTNLEILRMSQISQFNNY